MKPNKSNSAAFSEVIESSLHHFKAQCWQWDDYPSYGSLVCVEQGAYLFIGIVHEVATGSSDPSRAPFAYQKTEEQLKKEQPQIFEFLKTTFGCLVLGYRFKERWFYSAPAHPSKVHAFVRPATKEECQFFLSKERYLHRLFNLSGQIHNIDELLLALLSHASRQERGAKVPLQQFLQTYALLTGNDYRRIKLFLQQAEPLLQVQK